ncbi:hypothetical protein FA95DRAFT_1564199 [Auriscalpium vulgare]|uniref:Uncharacterized protein n=1 Tax=Auriscalpium vulgare TaxID=40419 RepID=A0ACB8REP4_9AGAM|nr:hypothetical protein FA95DRAFT_1564199 [Auriscalpium vulgare]
MLTSRRATVYQIATVDSSNRPHVRSQIHRGFLTPPGLPHLPLLLTSTDSRTPKTKQLAHTDFVELAWWIDGSADQFRVLGRARLVSSAGISPARTPPECAGLAALDAAGFDWEGARRGQFDDVSEHMRASWCRPPPGDVLPGGYEEMDSWPTTVKKPSDARTEEEKALAAEALGNYALVVIEPLEVDWVQMAIRPNRRTRFTRVDDGWEEVPVVP